MSGYPTITRVAREPMPWGVRVAGDATHCWATKTRRGMIGVLRRPLGPANSCAAGDIVEVRTSGHIIAVIGNDAKPVRLVDGRDL